MTKQEIIKFTAQKLKENGLEPYNFEAKEIVESVVGKTFSDNMLTCEQESQIEALLNRRLNHEPLQYILGEWEFYGLPVKVGKGVLIPRSDTETAVDCALKKLKVSADNRVFDLCAGSGCIGLALAVYGKARVTFFEKSDAALPYLLQNIKLNGVNADVYEYDVLCKLPEDLKCDILVSNPPYIKTEVINTLPSEVKHEPKTALDGGEDGLLFYRHIASEWKASINDGGWLIFEIGFDQADEVAEILETAGYKNIEIVKDLGQNDRVAMGQKFNGV